MNIHDGMEKPFTSISSQITKPNHGITYDITGHALDWVIDGLILGKRIVTLPASRATNKAASVIAIHRLLLPILQTVERSPELNH